MTGVPLLSLEPWRPPETMRPGIIGVDPGAEGAFCYLGPDGPSFLDAGRVFADVVDWLRACQAEAPLLHVSAVVEAQHAFPQRPDGQRGSNVVGAFAQGMNYGQILGALMALRIPTETVSSMTWKKEFGLLSRGVEKAVAKEQARAKARELYPDAELHLKKHHGRADALLMAEWKRRKRL